MTLNWKQLVLMHVECCRCVEQTASEVCNGTRNSTVTARTSEPVDIGCLMSCLLNRACAVFCALAVANFQRKSTNLRVFYIYMFNLIKTC